MRQKSDLRGWVPSNISRQGQPPPALRHGLRNKQSNLVLLSELSKEQTANKPQKWWQGMLRSLSALYTQVRRAPRSTWAPSNVLTGGAMESQSTAHKLRTI